MTKDSVRTEGGPPAHSWLELAAFVAAVPAAIAAGLLCAALLGWKSSVLPMRVDIIFASLLVWLVCGIAGVACGVIAITSGHRGHVRVVVAIVLSLVSLQAVCGAALIRGKAEAFGPSDGALITNFNEHEADFTAVMNHLQLDPSVRRAQLGALSADITQYSEDYSEFWVASWGIVPSGWAKGYAYSAQPPSPTVADLDHNASADGYSYRHIKGDWYLFYYLW